MGTNDDLSITKEVTNRLNEFFGVEDLPENDSEHRKGDLKNNGKSTIKVEPSYPVPDDNSIIAKQNSPLKDMGAIVLSMDWEITDEIMNALIDEINRLKGIYGNDKIILSFLLIHDSLGRYIKAKKADANPKSIKLLQSVYEELEKVMTSPGMARKEKKKILFEELRKVNNLKKQILKNRNVGSDGKTNENITYKALDQYLSRALKEIRETIKEEFVALREELISWKQGV